MKGGGFFMWSEEIKNRKKVNSFSVSVWFFEKLEVSPVDDGERDR